ncbi:MAG: glycosyltransferase [Candidatus Acidiferrum sp.]
MIEQTEEMTTGKTGVCLPNPRTDASASIGSKDLSILIVNWNSKDYLRPCLASIYRETHGLEFEVIVVDNASFDGAAEMVAAEFPQVRFIQSQTNLGFARANNLAFENSLGKTVFLLNPDTEIVGNAIPIALAVMGELKDAGIVGFRQLNTDSSLQTQCIKRFPTILGELLDMEWLRRAWPSCKLWSIDSLFADYSGPVQVDAVSGACQMISREVYKAAGGLNTSYFMYSEDIDICAAALSKGRKTYWAGNAEIIHHGGKSSHASDCGDRWISIMQRQASWQFYRAWRGTGYASLYRAVIAVMSVLWIVALTISWPALFVIGKKAAAERIWRKWTGALKWSLGLEGLSTKFRGQPVRVSNGADATNSKGCPAMAEEWKNQGIACHSNAPQLQQRRKTGKYVLMTAAYNEEENIGKTIESLLSQTQLPERWVIVSDGSQDRTEGIIRSYAEGHGLIRFLRVSRPPGRSFGSKVMALKEGAKLLDGADFEFIGNLDADVTVDATYFEDLIARFESLPKLGLAGGFVYEQTGGQFRSRRANRTYSVAHAAQLVRRQCYEAIGGYAILKYGGEDWHAQTCARMKGWEAEAIPELNILHHRKTGEAGNLLAHKFRQGRMDYSFGSDPVFETLKCLERLPEKPFFAGGITRLTGFLWASICREERPVSADFIAFLRREQRQKLKSIFRGGGRHEKLYEIS